jgi:uncharacterized protein
VKILVAGGTGFVGRALIKALADGGHHVTALVRNSVRQPGYFPAIVQIVVWDGKGRGDWCREVEDADVVINLAGASVGSGRWTERRKKLILESRVEPTRALVDAMRMATRRARVLINASAVGFYGMSGEGIVTEESAGGSDFLAVTCSLWEFEALKARSATTRVALIRLGVVLAGGGGVLDRMLLPFRIFLGGPLGSGKQWYPWVHREDVVGAIVHVLNQGDIRGAINVVAPEAVTMGGFAKELGRALGRPSWLPVPSFLLRLLFGEMAGMVLEGRRIEPARLLATGFSFRHPTLRGALEAIL